MHRFPVQENRPDERVSWHKTGFFLPAESCQYVAFPQDEHPTKCAKNVKSDHLNDCSPDIQDSSALNKPLTHYKHLADFARKALNMVEFSQLAAFLHVYDAL